MRYLILIAFIMNACAIQIENPVEETDDMRHASQSGTLTPGSRGSAVQLQTPFQDQSNHTVQFLIDGIDESATNATRITRADVTWSVSGNSVKRTIDVVNGTSITGTAEAVSVKVTDASTQFVGLSPYTVSIQVAKGSRPSIQQPPYLTTDLIVLPPGAGSSSVLVPQNAGAISAFVTVAPNVGVPIVSQWDVRVGHSSGNGELKAYSPIVETSWVPLASGTTRIFVSQGAAAPGTTWTVTFGIDG
jgi:hypothetical protein